MSLFTDMLSKNLTYDDLEDVDVTSYPSAAFAVIEIPEPTRVRVKFIYNFWVRDERVNENVRGSVVDSLAGQTLSDGEIKKMLRTRNLPRMIEIRWRPVELPGEYIDVNPAHFGAVSRSAERRAKASRTSIKRNFNSIVREEAFSNGRMIGISMMDNASHKLVYNLSKSAMAMFGTPIPAEDLDETHEPLDIDDLFDSGTANRAKIIKKEAALEASASGKQDLISSLMGDIQAEGFAYSKGETRARTVDRALDPAKSMSLNLSLNSIIGYNILLSAARDKTKIYSDEFESILGQMKDIQDTHIKNFKPSIISESDFEFEIPYIRIRAQKYREYKTGHIKKNTPGNRHREGAYNRSKRINPNHMISHVTGYIIEKREVMRNGFFKEHDPIIIEDPDRTRIIDTNVKYGAVYQYKIRAVVEVKFEGVLDHDGDGDAQNVITTSLIASRGTKEVVVECKEEIPPEPPVNLNFDFFPYDDMLTVSWEFPINVQRDIKRFHVFRRRSINKPFRLIAEYNFDTTVNPVKIREKIPRKLRSKSDTPVCLHDDFDFDFDRPAIYTVCAVDSHGMVSNYSSQYIVKIDPVTRKAKKRLISRPGAPRTYPNIYLEDDTFLDTIKTSMYKDVRIYFDPEYLGLIDSNESDLHLLRTHNTRPCYKINFINTDLQQSDTLNIFVKDGRKRDADIKRMAGSFIQNSKDTT